MSGIAFQSAKDLVEVRRALREMDCGHLPKPVDDSLIAKIGEVSDAAISVETFSSIYIFSAAKNRKRFMVRRDKKSGAIKKFWFRRYEIVFLVPGEEMRLKYRTIFGFLKIISSSPVIRFIYPEKAR